MLEPGRRLRRHLLGAFLLFTAATGLGLWHLETMPQADDELGVGRGCVWIALAAIWLTTFIFFCVRYIHLRRVVMPHRSAGIEAVLLWLLAACGSAFLGWDVAVGVLRPPRSRGAAESLKTLASAEADFRANDRDGNGIADFWTGDVAGLYRLRGGDGEEIKLIEIFIARADARPLPDDAGEKFAPLDRWGPPSAKAGYRYRSLLTERRSLSKFAFCAYPEGRGRRLTYIISEASLVYEKDTQGVAPEVFPADPAAEGWKAVGR